MMPSLVPCMGAYVAMYAPIRGHVCIHTWLCCQHRRPLLCIQVHNTWHQTFKSPWNRHAHHITVIPPSPLSIHRHFPAGTVYWASSWGKPLLKQYGGGGCQLAVMNWIKGRFDGAIHSIQPITWCQQFIVLCIMCTLHSKLFNHMHSVHCSQ